MEIETQTGSEVKWNFDIPMLTSRFVLFDLLKLIVLTPLLACVVAVPIFVAVNGLDWDALRGLGMLLLVGTGVLAALLVISILLFYWNRFPVAFTVNAEGAVMEMTRKQKRINSWLFWMALLMGKPGAMGTALIARSQESIGMSWADTRQIDYFPRQRVISLRNSWRTVLRLHCTPENYEAVAAICRESFDGAASQRDSNIVHASRRRTTVWRQTRSALPWMGAALVCSVLVMGSPLLDAPAQVWAACGTCLLGSIPTGAIRRLLGIAGLVLVASVAIAMTVNGLYVTKDLFGIINISGFASAAGQSNRLGFVVSLVGMLGLLACSLRNALADAPKGMRRVISIAGVAVACVWIGGCWAAASHPQPFRPEIQAVEVYTYDDEPLRSFKYAYNSKVEWYKFRASASSGRSREAAKGYAKALAEYDWELRKVRKSGKQLDIQEAELLDQAFDLWVRTTRARRH